jgi:ATP-dependent Clp protease adapter protein ClpS
MKRNTVAEIYQQSHFKQNCRLYKVFLYNDDYTIMKFLKEEFKSFFFKDEQQTNTIMNDVQSCHISYLDYKKMPIVTIKEIAC